MSIEQLIRITIAGVILYALLSIMGEVETLRWMMLVIGLTIVALCVSTLTKENKKE